MAPTGIKTFSSGGMAVTRFESKPVQPGEYEGVLRASKWEERKAEGAGKLPYLNGPIELFGTGEDGGKNRVIFHRLWLSVVPKDGKESAAVQGQDQSVALARALGEDLNGVPLLSGITQTLNDKKGNKIGERKTDILNPKALLQWIKNHDAQVFKLRVKTKKGEAGYSDQSVVDYFIEADEAAEMAPEGEELAETGTGEEVPTEYSLEEAFEEVSADGGFDSELEAGLEGEEPEAEFEPIPPARKPAAPAVKNGHNKMVAKPVAKAPPPAAKRPVQKAAVRRR